MRARAPFQRWSVPRGYRSKTPAQQGFFIVLFAVCLMVLLGIAGIAVDIGKWYLSISRLQNTTDAAALAGAVYLPVDPATAINTADRVFDENSASEFTKSTAIRRPARSNPSYMYVKASTEVHTEFMHLLGLQREWRFTRSSTAIWRGAIDSGKWSNVLGHETTAYGKWAPVEKQTFGSDYWPLVSGGSEMKDDGFRYTARKCRSSSYSDCAGSTNSEYLAGVDPNLTRGEEYLIYAPPGLVGQHVSVEVYDPAFALQGEVCSRGQFDDLGELYDATHNPMYAPDNLDACAGDDTEWPTNDKFTSTEFSFEHTDGTPAASCSTKTFQPYGSDAKNGSTVSMLDAYNTDPLFREVFHNWYHMCDIPYDPVKGVEVRMRVRSETQAVGVNAYAIRAGLFSGGVLLPESTQRRLLVYSPEHLQVHVSKKGGNSVIPIAMVPPSYAGQTIEVSVFDLGDADKPATFSVVSDSTTVSGNVATADCSYTPPGSSTFQLMPNCQVGGVYDGSGWNGQTVRIRWRVPSDYRCDPSQQTLGQSCALFASMTYAAGSDVYDNWTASTQSPGWPVRLVRNIE